MYSHCEEHKLPFSVGEKTILILNQALEYFSAAQIYNFIWRAARDAAAFYQREQVAKQHAANTVVGAIQRMVEHARDRNWDVTAYRRHFQFPQSTVSQVLFSAALHIGDGGFNISPRQWQKPESEGVIEVVLDKKITTSKTETLRSNEGMRETSSKPGNNLGYSSRRINHSKKKKRRR